jgi:hypothetical protein
MVEVGTSSKTMKTKGNCKGKAKISLVALPGRKPALRSSTNGRI